MQFYRLGYTGVGSWMVGVGDELTLEQREDIVYARNVPTDPFEVQPVDGKRLPDLLSISAWLYCVSPRMLSVLDSLSATGYTAFPVVLRHPVVGCTINGYHGLAVHGRRELRTKKWDGTDVHVMEGYGFNIWVTERVAKALQKVKPKLRDLTLSPTTEQPET